MAVFPDKIILKNSTDSQATIEAAIGSGGADEIVYGELVIGRESGAAKLYTVDSDGNIAVVGGAAGAQSIDDLTDVDTSTTPPTDGQALAWDNASSQWKPSTFAGGVTVIDDLSDVDTTTVAPTDGQALVWDNVNSQWEPGTIAGGAQSIDDLTDVDTTTVPPTDGQALVWDNANSQWEPATLAGGVTAINDLTDVDTATVPPTDGQPLLWDNVNSKWEPGTINLGDLGDVDVSFSHTPAPDWSTGGRVLMSYDNIDFVYNQNTFSLQARNGFEFISGAAGTANGANQTYIQHRMIRSSGAECTVEVYLNNQMADGKTVRLGWPLDQTAGQAGVVHVNWENTGTQPFHRMELRPFYLNDVSDLLYDPSPGFGDSIFFDGNDWGMGDLFTPGATIAVTDLGTSGSNMIGQAAMYQTQANMQAAGWTYITGGGVDDASTAFSPGASWLGLDFLGLGVSSANWKVADVGVHFDADPNHNLNDYDQPMTFWPFDLLVQYFKDDSKLTAAGYKIHNDGTQDWLVVRTEHELLYGEGSSEGIPCESWFGQDGRIRMMYGVPADVDSNFTFTLSSVSNGIASNSNVVTNPKNLTIGGDRAYEFEAVSYPGVPLGRLTDVDTTTVAPTDGQVLAWDNTNSVWEPASLRTLLGIGEYVDDTAAGSGGVASGALYYNTTSSDYRLKT